MKNDLALLAGYSDLITPTEIRAILQLKKGAKVAVLLCLKLRSGLVPELVAIALRVRDFCMVNDSVDHC